MACKPQTGLLVLLGFLLAVFARGEVGFQPHMTQARWIAKSMDSRCELFQPIPDYGTAVFVQYSGQPQEFHLNAHRSLFEQRPMNVVAESPPWHPHYPQSEVLGQAKTVSPDRVTVVEPLATSLLMTLYEGKTTAFSQQSWFDQADQVVVRLSNIAFRDKYESYMRCRKSLKANSFAKLERSSVYFAVDRWELTDPTRKRLDELVSYCNTHPEVNMLYVDGHTDNSGTRERNLLLSKRRAEAVRTYLMKQGLKKDMLIARYHAERYPIASNDTKEGKSRNRRTTVRLEQPGSSVARR